jgi:hypothetical protein
MAEKKMTPFLSLLKDKLDNYRDKFNRLDCDVLRPLSIKTMELAGKAFPVVSRLEYPLKQFLSSFATIPASPERKALFESVYTFPNERFLAQRKISHDLLEFKSKLQDPYTPEVYPNVSYEISNCFLDHIMSLINNLRKDRSNPSKVSSRTRRDSIFFLVGDPGIGKTTFLNYLFSVNSEKLRNEKIIWIRLDLNDPTERKDDFATSFLLKTISILRDKYSKEINFSDPNLRAFIFDKWAIDPEKSSITIKDVDSFFRRLQGLRKFNIDQQLDVSFIDIILDFLIEKLGYGFIFVVDGLDRVTLDSVRNERFASVVLQ